MRYLILGSGPAGIFAAEAIRMKDPIHPIKMVSQDSALAYSPVMLTYWMTGKRPQETLFFRDPSWAERMRIDVKLGCRASGLRKASRILTTEGGEEISYDRLLIATGSSPISLPIAGVEAKGVTSIRYVHDAERILSEGPNVKEAVIIGGGFVGLKLACHLEERGVGVAVFEKETKLSARVLDEKASLLIQDGLRQRGIRIETDVKVAEILNEKGWVTGVRMKDGRTFSCQRVIQAVGVRPNTQFLSGSGLDIQDGILVNERMETNVPEVYGAGDVTMTVDSISSDWVNNAIWPAASRQGTVAGWNMAGGNRTYTHNFPLNSLNLFGLRVMSAGHPYFGKGSGADVFMLEEKESYRKIVIRDGRLIGFILVGDISGAGFLLKLIKTKDVISYDPMDLLNGRVSFGDALPPNLGYQHGLLFNPLRGK